MATSSLIDEHLAVCPSCRDFYETNDDISQLISHCDDIAHPGPEYLENLSENVMNSLFDESGEFKKVDLPAPPPPPMARAHRWGRPLYWVGGAAVAASLVLGLVPGLIELAQQSRNGRFEAASNDATFSGREKASARTSLGAAQSARSERADLSDPGTRIGMLVASAANPLGFGWLSPLAIPAAAEPAAARPRTASASYQLLKPSFETANPAGRATVTNASTRGSADHEWVNNPDLASRMLEEMVIAQAIETPEGRERLAQLFAEFREALSATQNTSISAGEPALALQFDLFQQAELSYRREDFEESARLYVRSFDIDPTTLIACRASMRLGDLNYYEFENFRDAQNYYSQCRVTQIELAHPAAERAHIAEQCEILSRFKPDQYRPLVELSLVRRGPWTDAVAGCVRLAGDGASRSLVPAAARAMADRLEAAPNDRPGDQQLIGVIEVLEGLDLLDDGPQAAAEVQLAIGDLYWRHFANAARAIGAYRKAMELGPETESANLADHRLRELREQALRAPSR